MCESRMDWKLQENKLICITRSLKSTASISGADRINERERARPQESLGLKT